MAFSTTFRPITLPPSTSERVQRIFREAGFDDPYELVRHATVKYLNEFGADHAEREPPSPVQSTAEPALAALAQTPGRGSNRWPELSDRCAYPNTG